MDEQSSLREDLETLKSIFTNMQLNSPMDDIDIMKNMNVIAQFLPEDVKEEFLKLNEASTEEEMMNVINTLMNTSEGQEAKEMYGIGQITSQEKFEEIREKMIVDLNNLTDTLSTHTGEYVDSLSSKIEDS